ncbi:serine/threonine-protein kinase Nek8 [Toxorhynchites rutilus septentrionalis]|uniref:serine/threonine-protein kinase Nek8 n=1 Tax=Toxorhynchites rutilus septentrionalis TaxID=329112 RepID=UPI00247A2D7E|nr:serine/threonine-protein kinase Nek8 [Toxorhynchites rutilus septentrionalis]
MNQTQTMAETVAIGDKNLNDVSSSSSIELSTLSRFKDLSLSGLQSINRSSLQNSDNPKDSGNESEGEIELSGYHRIRTVGQGSFGIAVLYERLGDGQSIVMKQINLSDLSKSERDLAMNEVEVFSKLHHPNIIAYLGSFVRGNYLFIEMEYADGGTLAQILIDKSQGERLPERFILNIFEQITSAITYMHSQNILHRDLKTANVFMNKRGIVKIGDFGISKIMSTRVQAQTVLGTPYYFSPEMCEGKQYDEKSDVWALGCVLGEMCCFRKAFSASNLSELISKIMTARYVPLPEGYSETLRHVLSLMLQIDPQVRPSASEILQYWIPLIYRNLGKNGFKYISNEITDMSSERTESSSIRMGTATRNYMQASTATMNNLPLTERSVLYQLKSFGTSTSLNPLQLPPTGKIRQIATSGAHFVAVMYDGSVYSWGEGDTGQLGHNALETWRHYPTRIDTIRKYTVVGAATGTDFTIFWTDLGVVLSCGDNSHGCLGHGNTVSLLVPKIIDELNNIKIVQVACGTHHVAALSDEGDLYTWGSSAKGALGLGKQMLTSSVPRRLIISQMIQTIEQICCGPDCTVILSSNGSCYCCGSNDFNVFGFGQNITQLIGLRKITFITQKILAVSIAETHGAFLIEGGYVVTAGDNCNGQRGLGHTHRKTEPTLLKSLTSRFVTKIRCHSTYTVATTDDNCILFWGTRLGIPEADINASSVAQLDNEANRRTSEMTSIGNSTAAFTNFLTSVYKYETILDPIDILALYSSKDQQEKGSYLKLADIKPLLHSVLVTVDTTCPLI